MSSTQGYNAKSVFMCQGTTHLRVSSSAELKVAAGGQFMLDYEQSTGKTGSISNRGVTYLLTTAQGSTFFLKAPVRGAFKKIFFRSKTATSGFLGIKTTDASISISKTSIHCIRVDSSAQPKSFPLGISWTLLGLSAVQWALVDQNFGSLDNPTTRGNLVVFTT